MLDQQQENGAGLNAQILLLTNHEISLSAPVIGWIKIIDREGLMLQFDPPIGLHFAGRRHMYLHTKRRKAKGQGAVPQIYGVMG